MPKDGIYTPKIFILYTYRKVNSGDTVYIIDNKICHDKKLIPF